MVKYGFGFVLLLSSLVLPIGPVRGTVTSRGEIRSLSAKRMVPEGQAGVRKPLPHWYWIYEGVAHGQTFVASDTQVTALRLRVARLGEERPAAPLEVEIRDPSLRLIYVHGTISVSDAGQGFTWATAKFDHRAPLEREQTYVLLVHSKDTHHAAPWAVNTAFTDCYSGGRHLGYQDDFFFSISFHRGLNLHVGPPLNASPTLPHNSGKVRCLPMPTHPSLRFVGRTCPPIALNDPLGPLPRGKQVEVDPLMGE